MDGNRFDALARVAASQRTRRGAVGAIGAVALVGLGLRSAEAAPGTELCKDSRQSCDSRDECCGGGRLRCQRISRRCNKNRLRRENRCCSTGDTPCRSSCDCCQGFTCNTATSTCEKD
jgi:hypothetical protein